MFGVGGITLWRDHTSEGSHFEGITLGRDHSADRAQVADIPFRSHGAVNPLLVGGSVPTCPESLLAKPALVRLYLEMDRPLVTRHLAFVQGLVADVTRCTV